MHFWCKECKQKVRYKCFEAVHQAHVLIVVRKFLHEEVGRSFKSILGEIGSLKKKYLLAQDFRKSLVPWLNTQRCEREEAPSSW